MPSTERYQVDFFAILVLIASVLVLVFLIIASIYFFNLMNLKPPSRGESTFLFWTAIILAIILIGLAIYALIRIFTYKAVVYEEPVKQATITTTVPTVTPIPIVPVNPTPIVIKPVVTTPTPIKISNVPITTPKSDVSVSLSDIPVTSKQRSKLNEELINLRTALED